MEEELNLKSKSNDFQHTDFELYVRLLKYIYPYLLFFILSIIGFICYSIGNVLLADLMQFLLDALNGELQETKGVVSNITYSIFSVSDHSGLDFARIAVPVAAVFLAFFRSMGFFCGTYFMNHVSRGLIHALRCELFDKLLLAPISQYDASSSGELVSKITFNVEQVSESVSTALKIILRDGLTVIGLACYLLYLNWQLSLLFFCVAPLIAGVVVLVGRYFRRYSRRIQKSMGSVTHLSSEALQSPREIRLFGGQADQSDRFRSASDYNRKQSLKLTFAEAIATPVVQTLLAFSLSILIWFSLSPEIMKDFSVGSLVAFLTAAGLIGKPIRSLSGIQVIVQKGLAACEDIFYQLDLESELNLGKYVTKRSKGAIVLKNVSFRYAGSASSALENISLEIKAGETIAIVGPSGSGKTTLVQLLARFYAPSTGEITLDEINIEDYCIENFRSQISMVSQSVTLFRDTVFNNIAFGELKGSSSEKVFMASKMANSTAFIDALSDGFQTQLSDDGESISGGQRQRIAISRAVLKDAPIFILDEATSALDSESESLIQEALNVIMSNRTSIIIAHRLSTVEKADRICVLDEGKVIAVGNHSELLQQQGLYAQLYNKDFKD